MSRQSREELVRSIHPRYLKATKAEKGRILDEFVADTAKKSVIKPKAEKKVEEPAEAPADAAEAPEADASTDAE